MMRSQLSTYIWRKMGLKYSCHWQYVFFPSGYWHHKKWWKSQSITMNECEHRKNSPKWKEYIPTKLYSLEKWEVFRLVVQTLEVVKLVGLNKYL